MIIQDFHTDCSNDHKNDNDGSDESLDICQCGYGMFRCGKETNSLYQSCIPLLSVCDGALDCPYGEDEDPKQCMILSSIAVSGVTAPESNFQGLLKVNF